MDLLGDLLKNKAEQIDLDDKRQALAIANEELSRFFDKKQAKVVVVSDKTLTVNVKNSPLASEVRMSQVIILESISRALQKKMTKLYIRTGRI